MVSSTSFHGHNLLFSSLPPPFFQRFSHFLPIFSPPKHRIRPEFSKFPTNGAAVGNTHASLPETHEEAKIKDVDGKAKGRTDYRVSSSRPVNGRKGDYFAKTRFSLNRRKDKRSVGRTATKGVSEGKELEFVDNRVLGNQSSRRSSRDKRFAVNDSKRDDATEVGGETEKKAEINGKRTEKAKAEPTGHIRLRIELDMCSKRGDVMGAIELYDKAQRKGIKLKQYHYTVLLYLCSSAAAGVVRPAKSGSGIRSLNTVSVSCVSREGLLEMGEMRDENYGDNRIRNDGNGKMHKGFDEKGLVSGVEFENSDGGLAEEHENLSVKLNVQHNNINCQEENGIVVSEKIKRNALRKGFEIYKKMCSDDIPMNEASLTSVARMAVVTGDGDLAFGMVKQMKSLGIKPRLRSYAPALSLFCDGGEIEKAFMVEKHMLDNGVYPEEPELETLLRASVEAGRGEKVYYLLHKLRTTVRSVSPSTAETIRKWFESRMASRVGKKKPDLRKIKEAMEQGGGGWHGHGWLGRGKWVVSDSSIGVDGFCKCCGEKLAIIDLDPIETENFAQLVASIARKREKNSNFQRFQKWLDYYGPFEAVVDAANVGLFSQKRFKPSKVNAVVNGIRQMLPSRKWPLIVLHNKRITEPKMDQQPSNKTLFEKWRNADALYATPTGSNDDWYWLYAAIKFKCLVITNDEMRDHTFQLLGNNFFPKWKERHQVHFRFSEAGPVFRMPPPYSVAIQESEKGHWHIPIVSINDSEEDRRWICIVRANSLKSGQTSATELGDLQEYYMKDGCTWPITQDKLKTSHQLSSRNIKDGLAETQELYQSLRKIVSGSEISSDDYHSSILSELEAAEKLAGRVIDFQI